MFDAVKKFGQFCFRGLHTLEAFRVRSDLLILESINIIFQLILIGLEDLVCMADGGKSRGMGKDLIEMFYRVIIVCMCQKSDMPSGLEGLT